MAVHLQEMMEDGETFGWPMFRAYHTVLRQHLHMAHASAISCLPHHPPDHVTTTSGIPMALIMEQQGFITHTCSSHSRSPYTASMLGIYGVETASGQKILLPSNFIFNEWENIAQSQVDHEVLQCLRYRFPMDFEGSMLHPHLAIMPQQSTIPKISGPISTQR